MVGAPWLAEGRARGGTAWRPFRFRFDEASNSIYLAGSNIPAQGIGLSSKFPVRAFRPPAGSHFVPRAMRWKTRFIPLPKLRLFCILARAAGRTILGACLASRAGNHTPWKASRNAPYA